MSETIPPILAAEDEESDALILRTAFENAQISNRLVIARDGQEAVDYLAGTGRFADRWSFPLPVLILLDLKMPRMSGFDVLGWLGSRPDLQNIPSVVLSSSSHEADIEKARKLGAVEYFVKPFAFAELVKIVQQMQTRWLSKPRHQSPNIRQQCRPFSELN
jgi:CheY-like chemotaxis protein